MRSPLCLRSRFGLLSLSLILLAGCGGGDILLPGDGEPTSIAVVDGDGQRGRVGEPLTNPLVVEVKDSRGLTVAGATVAFEFSSAGAGAAVVPQERTTDANGRAEAQLVLGTTIGRQTGQARVVGGAGSTPIQATFSAMALPENANTMAAVAGQDQTGHVGLPLDDRLVVEVTDGFGNPVAGVPISWAAVGGGSVSADVVETDEDGRSRVDRVLGPAVGQQSTVASSEGLAGSPVTFLHTAIAGDASRLVILSGSDQTGEAGTLLPADLVVQLIDSDGNGVPQTAVSWVVATGGGSVAPEITTTDADGRTSARWTLGGTPGQQRLDAVVSGVGVATFRATATSGAPASLVIRTQPSGTARNGIPLSRQPVLQLRDSRGNDAAQAGIEVTAAIGSGGGELGGTRQVTTDGFGRASFTDLSISGGPGPRTLVFTAPGYAQVTSNEVDLQAISTTTSITGDSPDPSGVGASFTVSFTVGSQGPTPTGSVTVSDGVESCSGPLANGAGSCQLALTTAGTRTLTATYSGEPGLGGSSDTESHTVTAAPPANEAPTTEFATTCNELDCRFEDQSNDPDGRIASRLWNFGDGETSDGRDPHHQYSNNGTYQVSLMVTDNDGATASVSHQVTVSAAAASTKTRFEVDNPDPTIPGQSFTVTLSVSSERGTPEGSATLTDGVDGCTVPIVSGSGSCSLALSTVGDRTLTATYQGNSSFATSSANESHTVKPAPPVGTTTTITSDDPDPSDAEQQVTVSFTVTASTGSPDGTVQVTADGGGSCSATVAQGSCALTPGQETTIITAEYQGSSSFASSSDTEPHDVRPANQPPTAVDDVATTDAGLAVTIPVLANDTDPEGSTLTFAAIGDPPNGSAVDDGSGGILYTPDPGFNGPSDSFTYTVSDGSLPSNAATVTVTVNAPPPPPAPGSVGILTQSPSRIQSGRRLLPEPEVEMRDAGGNALPLPGVTISAAIASGSGTLGGILSRPTDPNGRARFDELRVNGPVVASVTLAFTAGGFAQVDSQPILIEEDSSGLPSPALAV